MMDRSLLEAFPLPAVPEPAWGTESARGAAWKEALRGPGRAPGPDADTRVESSGAETAEAAAAPNQAAPPSSPRDVTAATDVTRRQTRHETDAPATPDVGDESAEGAREPVDQVAEASDVWAIVAETPRQPGTDPAPPGTSVSVVDGERAQLDVPDRSVGGEPAVDAAPVGTALASSHPSPPAMVEGAAAVADPHSPADRTRRRERPSKEFAFARRARASLEPHPTSPVSDGGAPPRNAPHASTSPHALVETVGAGRNGAGTLGVAEPTGGELARGHASPDNAGTMAKAVTSPQTGELSGNQADRVPAPLASRPAGDSASHPPLTPQQQLRMMQRVARAVEAATPGGGVIRLRLHPAELGALQLEVSVNRGVLHARLKTETETARQVLLEQLPYLRDRLEQQGVRMEQFQVDVDRPDTPNYGGQEDPRDLAQQTPRKVPASRTRGESPGPETERHGTEQHGRSVRYVMGQIDVMI